MPFHGTEVTLNAAIAEKSEVPIIPVIPVTCDNCGNVQEVHLDAALLDQCVEPLLKAREAEIYKKADVKAHASYERALEEERGKREVVEEALEKRDQQLKEERDAKTELLRKQLELEDDIADYEHKMAQERLEIRKDERTKAQADAKKRAEEESLERDAKHEEQMRRQAEEYEVKLRGRDDQLKRVTDEVEVLRRKADSGVPTEEGLARQDLYGDELRRCFPDDLITVTPRGKPGWDVDQVVRHGKLECGPIPQEVKRAKFQDEYVRVLAARVRKNPAAKFGILVCLTLPPGTKGTSQIGDIWVTDFAHAIGAITMLREMVIMLHWSEMAGAAKADSAAKVHDYFTSPSGLGARYRALEEIADRLSGDNGKFDQYSQRHVARTHRNIGEIRDLVLQGIYLDLIRLGVEIPPWLDSEGDAPDLDEGDHDSRDEGEPESPAA